MRDDNSNYIIKDFARAKSLALIAADKYLSGGQIMGDRDGFWHGKTGKHRVLKLKQYLQIVDAKNHLILVALFLAVFKTRSSRLAELITEEWVKGENRDYTSEVFSTEALFTIGAPEAEPVTYIENFDNSSALFKKAVKTLLKAAAEQPEFKKDSAKMQTLVKSLKRVLDDGSLRINLQILPPTPGMANLYTSAAMVGAFSTTMLPIEICMIISANLTRAEAARSLVRINRAASQRVKIPEVLQRDFKTHDLLYHAEFISSQKAAAILPTQALRAPKVQAGQETILQPALRLEEKTELKEIKILGTAPLSSSQDIIFSVNQPSSSKTFLPCQALRLGEKANPILVRREVKEHIKIVTEAFKAGDLTTCHQAIEYLQKMSISPFNDRGAEQFLKDASTQEIISQMNFSFTKTDKQTSSSLKF